MKNVILFCSITIFYFLTSFIFLNRVTLNSEVSFPSKSNLKKNIYYEKAMMVKSITERLEAESSYRLERIFIATQIIEQRVFVSVRLSLAKSNFFSLFSDTNKLKENIRLNIKKALIESGACQRELLNLIPYNELRMDFIYFFDDKIFAIIKLVLYSIIFSTAVMLVFKSKSIFVLLEGLKSKKDAA